MPSRPRESNAGEPTLPAKNAAPNSIAWGRLAAPIAIVVAGVIAYSDCYRGQFFLDDAESISGNTTIRDLTNLGEVLWPPPRAGTTTDGRPVLNLSLALNYAVHGLDLTGYHAANVGFHVLNALLLWLVLQEVFRSPLMPESLRSISGPIVFSVALLWVVHPLTTAAVTYIIQRAEILMATFYLLTVYCFLRGCRSPQPTRWYLATAAVCLLGQGTKEVMATAPVALLFLDVACASGSWSAAWRVRKFWHALFFCTLFVTVMVVIATKSRSGTVGAAGPEVAIGYFVAQTGYLVRYLRLSFWPDSLVFDYGAVIPPLSWSQLPAFLTILSLGIVSAWLFLRKPLAGLPGVLFFIILAPTSSFVPVVTQIAAEHRMYLPLAAVLTVAVTLLSYLLLKILAARHGDIPAPRLAGGWLVGIASIVALAFTWLTLARNEMYHDKISLWYDTVRKTPENLRAAGGLAMALLAEKETDAAIAAFSPALQTSQAVEALCNRAEIKVFVGKEEEAEADLREALSRDPKSHRAHASLAVIADMKGDKQAALAHHNRAIELNPRADYYRERGKVLYSLGRRSEARRDIGVALKILPSDYESYYALAMFEYHEGRLHQSKALLEQALYYSANFPAAIKQLEKVNKELARSGTGS